MTERTITVIGSVNIDLVVSGDRLPREGETVLGHTFAVFPGGKGANQAASAARLGGRVRFIGSVGKDEYADLARRSLEAAGVNIDHLRTVHGHTGVALIAVDKKGRNQISVAPGANSRTRPRGRCDIALMQLETPFSLPRAETMILNAAPAAKVPLKGVDILIVNESEAELLSGKRDLSEAVRLLERRGAGRVIVTLGRRGVLDEGRVRRAFRVRAVDTVGAGDTFAGAFAAALSRGRDDPVRFAQAAAALSCTKPGARSAPRPGEVEKLLKGR